MNISELIIAHPCGRMMASPGWERDRATSLALRDHELWLVWRGRGWMSDGDRRWELRPGFCAWMRPGGIYDAGTSTHDPLGFSFIHFTGTFSEVPPEFFETRRLSFVDAAMRRIIDGVSTQSLSSYGEVADVGLAETTLLKAVLLDVLETPREAPRPRHAEAFDEIASALRHDPADPTTVAEWARRLGVTPAHFSRTFRDHTGHSPQAYRIEARLERARELLMESGLAVQQIADALGYADPFVFSKQFKQRLGMSPSAYRRVRKEKAPGLE